MDSVGQAAAFRNSRPDSLMSHLPRSSRAGGGQIAPVRPSMSLKLRPDDFIDPLQLLARTSTPEAAWSAPYEEIPTMICRLWRGWTIPENAARYEQLLRDTVIPEIEAKKIPGFRHIDVMRRSQPESVEFATIMWFDDLDAIKAFVGEDYARAHVPASARALLARFDERSIHYEVLERREQVG